MRHRGGLVRPVAYAGFGNDSGWVIFGTGVDLGIEGTVVSVVPEPGSLPLLGFGMVLVAAIRRTGAPR